MMLDKFCVGNQLACRIFVQLELAHSLVQDEKFRESFSFVI